MKKLIEIGLIEEVDIENAKDVEIENFQYDEEEYIYEGQVQTGERTHELSVDMSTGEMGCDCERFNMGKKVCKHMVALLQQVMMENMDDIDHILKTIKDNGRFEEKYTDKTQEYLKSGCEAFDVMFDGGVPKKTISGVYGSYDTGKSILAHQLSAKAWSDEGKNTLYIDTEQSFVGLGGERYQEWFRERFDIPNFEVEYKFLNTVQKLLGAFGWHVELEYSEKSGKMDSILYPEGDNDIRKKMKDGNYGLVVVDSITDPVDGIMGSGQQSFPGRHPIQARLIKSLRNIAVDFDIPVFTVMHLSKGVRKWDSPDPKGGKGPGYGIKHICYLKGGRKIGGRKFERHRSIGLEGKHKEKAQLKRDYGFTDV